MTDSDSLGLRSGSDVLRPLCVARDLVAHTPSSRGRWHGLDEHSRAVGDLAAEFAEPFGGADVARLAGYLHDAGKATQEVQDRFRALGLSTGGSASGWGSRTSSRVAGLPRPLSGCGVSASLWRCTRSWSAITPGFRPLTSRRPNTSAALCPIPRNLLPSHDSWQPWSILISPSSRAGAPIGRPGSSDRPTRSDGDGVVCSDVSFGSGRCRLPRHRRALS